MYAVAVPAAVRRNARRDMPSFLARLSASSKSILATACCSTVGGRGMNSPFDTSESGNGDSESKYRLMFSSSAERVTPGR